MKPIGKIVDAYVNIAYVIVFFYPYMRYYQYVI